MFRFAIAGFFLLAALACAQAQPGPAEPVAVSAVDAARFLVENGHPDEAIQILDAVLADDPQDTEAQFLRGMAAVSQQDYDKAIRVFRAILAREPSAERVRLELARAFFLNADYNNAERQFRFARAGDVPQAVKHNIDIYLAAINRLREWSIAFSFGFAPDTNRNAATSAEQVDIFGLPFLLDQKARSQSGIGVMGEVSAEWSPLLAENTKLRMGSSTSRTEYGGGDFDDMTLAGYAGPQFLFDNWDMSLLGTAFRRWYGNEPFVAGVGGKAIVDHGITSDLLLQFSAGGQSLTNDASPDQSGALYSIALQGYYALSPSSLAQARVGFNRQEARGASYAYSNIWFGLGYQRDLPAGFIAGVNPSYYVTRYDAALAAFGTRRTDDTLILEVSLLNPRIDYGGFTPRLSYVFTSQRSNIPLFSYERNQIRIALTDVF